MTLATSFVGLFISSSLIFNFVSYFALGPWWRLALLLFCLVAAWEQRALAPTVLQLASGGASSQLAQWCSWKLAFSFIQESSQINSVGANAIVLSRQMIYLHAKFAMWLLSSSVHECCHCNRLSSVRHTLLLLMCIPGFINSFFVVNSMLSIGDMPSMTRNTEAEPKPVKAR